MQIKNRILDDIAKTATGLAGGITNIKGEVDDALKSKIERIISELDMVSREEFEVVRKMASLAREENETLKKQISTLKNKK